MIDMDDFIGSGLDVPMFVVTAADGAERSGCLVGFATQCSIDPLRFVVFLSKNNRTYRVARGADALAVHVVPEGRMDIAELFGARTGDEVDKFEHVQWRDVRGAPVLDDADSWFVGAVVDRVEGGDHTGFVLEPLEGAAADPVPALGFLEARRLDPGHEA